MFAPNAEWPSPPLPPTLSPDVVHVWRVGLERPPDDVTQLAALLSPGEQERADRFHFERHRRRFVVGRGTLRLILGRLLDVPPGALSFGNGPQGKPSLPGGPPFNVSHSGELALVAVADGRHLGVDLEVERPLPDAKAIARRFFSAAEQATLAALPPDQQTAAFFRCWTRKEAYIKAIGEGLSRPLDGFDVTLAPDEPARLLRVEGRPEEVGRWSMRALAPAPGYAAALVVEGSGWRLGRWTFGW